MPIYEYQCQACEHVFEELILRASDAAEVACPVCQTPKPERLLSASATRSSSSGGSYSGGGCAPRGGFS